jgi:phospholipase D1/2
MIVDDRIAIIGSANINERSQRGDRDSELACIIRDTDMVDSTMAGKPCKVGRFAHTMRVRLMREHLGVDVDALESEEMDMDLLNRQTSNPHDSQEVWDPESEQERGHEGVTWVTPFYGPSTRAAASLGAAAVESAKGVGEDVAGVSHRLVTKALGEKTLAEDKLEGVDEEPSEAEMAEGEVQPNGVASSVVPTIEEETIAEDRPKRERHKALPADEKNALKAIHDPPPKTEGEDTEKPVAEGQPVDDLSKSRDEDVSQPPPGEVHDTRKLANLKVDTDSYVPDDVARAHAPGESQRRPLSSSQERSGARKDAEAAANDNAASAKIKQSLGGKPNPYTIPTQAPEVDPKGFADPLSDSFYKDIWCTVAVRNTQIFRKVFR